MVEMIATDRVRGSTAYSREAVVAKTPPGKAPALNRLVGMKVAMATSPSHVGRPNEDFIGAAPGIVVLLDGAGIPGTEEICRHGVAWYSHTLGTTLWRA